MARESFWLRVSKGEGDDACWEWAGAISRRGYGIHAYGGRTYRAHRFAYELVAGPIPPGLFVCHRCDNRRCVRPGHLFLGTAKENTGDCIAKGRFVVARGEAKGGAKLTEADVLEIRRFAARGREHRDIAARFCVRRGTVTMIVNRRTWRHLPE